LALLPCLAAFFLPVSPLLSPRDFFWALESAAKVAARLQLVFVLVCTLLVMMWQGMVMMVMIVMMMMIVMRVMRVTEVIY
jgi:hypothetical protein